MHCSKRVNVIGMAVGADIGCNLQLVFVQGLQNKLFVVTGIEDQCLPVFAPDDVADFLKGASGNRSKLHLLFTIGHRLTRVRTVDDHVAL